MEVVGITKVRSVSAGYDHVLAIRTDGSVWTWGNNSEGAFGATNPASSATPVPVAGITRASAVSAGLGYSEVLRRP